MTCGVSFVCSLEMYTLHFLIEYKLKAKKEVSDMLSVLPREMEEIRASESKMLATEEMFEKRGSLVQL